MKKEAVNPKRLQRQIRKEVDAMGIGTKSQQVLQMQREESKLVRKVLSRKQREEEKQHQFELKQQKRKAKHRADNAPLLLSSRVWSRHTPTRSRPKGAETFQELNLWPRDVSCPHLFAAFRNFHISICSQIVDKLRLTRYYKGKPNTRKEVQPRPP